MIKRYPIYQFGHTITTQTMEENINLKRGDYQLIALATGKSVELVKKVKAGKRKNPAVWQAIIQTSEIRKQSDQELAKKLSTN